MQYITVGPFCWGRDETQEYSLINCIREWDSNYQKDGKTKFITYRCGDSARVHGLDGSIHWDEGDEPTVLVEENLMPVKLVEKFRDAFYDLLDSEDIDRTYGEGE